jgi:hypothetical protein
VIVVDPDDVARFEQRRQHGGEAAVDAHIAVEIRALEFQQTHAVVQKRPEG